MSAVAAPLWLNEWMETHRILLWGGADLRQFSTPEDEFGERFPFALSWAVPMEPCIMAGIRDGPNQAYSDEYARVNRCINDASAALAGAIASRGFRSQPLVALELIATIPRF